MALCVMDDRKGEIMKEGLSNKLTITHANGEKEAESKCQCTSRMVMIAGVLSSCVQ